MTLRDTSCAQNLRSIQLVSAQVRARDDRCDLTSVKVSFSIHDRRATFMVFDPRTLTSQTVFETIPSPASWASSGVRGQQDA